ncbi:S24 family peptidase [Bilifractor sp. HCP3S3_D3]|uniref:S24 family peptidase n=1 Tax=Bilifractor sp. HCP3S3_D3 TaxID=3438907 RepID=UPI003F89A27C
MPCRRHSSQSGWISRNFLLSRLHLEPYPLVAADRFNAEADTLIRVSGHSMEPVYHDGDMVYVKYTKDVENNDIVICTTAYGAGKIKPTVTFSSPETVEIDRRIALVKDLLRNEGGR